MSTPRDRYMSKSYRDPKSHTEAIDLEDVEFEDSVSSDTHYETYDESAFEIAAENAIEVAYETGYAGYDEEFDNSDPYDIEYDH